jgi:hypothetical protein
MNIPPDITQAIVTAAARELADRAAGELDELQLVSIAKAAQVLDVSQSTARRVIREFVDLGEASRRVRISHLRDIIKARTTGQPLSSPAQGGDQCLLVGSFKIKRGRKPKH